MSKRIFDLRGARYGAIIRDSEDTTMNHDSQYVRDLENLCSKLLPIYHKYYKLVGGPKPTLEMPVVDRLSRKEPALFKPWPLDN
jgi:hypothetical protein